MVKFLNYNKKNICKPLNEVVAYHEDQKTFMNYTKLISKEEEIDDHFSPSLFQEYIDKSYELRVYFINGCLHQSDAIVLESDHLTTKRLYNNPVIPAITSLSNSFSSKCLRLSL